VSPGSPQRRGPAPAGPWRPAHVHPIVTADQHQQLITRLYLAARDYLDSDVTGGQGPLIAHSQRHCDQLAF
jgi:protocatechuate 3,4-dioxygenase beta subunit